MTWQSSRDPTYSPVACRWSRQPIWQTDTECPPSWIHTWLGSRMRWNRQREHRVSWPGDWFHLNRYIMCQFRVTLKSRGSRFICVSRNPCDLSWICPPKQLNTTLVISLMPPACPVTFVSVSRGGTRNIYPSVVSLLWFLGHLWVVGRPSRVPSHTSLALYGDIRRSRVMIFAMGWKTTEKSSSTVSGIRRIIMLFVLWLIRKKCMKESIGVLSFPCRKTYRDQTDPVGGMDDHRLYFISYHCKKQQEDRDGFWLGNMNV
jgi:hypothetical protein